MKLFHLPILLAALCLAAPAAGLADDHHHGDRCYWHGPGYGYGYRGYRPYYYRPYAYGGLPFFGYFPPVPSVGITYSTAPDGPAYQNTQGDNLASEVQEALHRKGYYHGEIDGEPGPATRSAIREYQSDHHLNVNGHIDRGLVHSLGLD